MRKEELDQAFLSLLTWDKALDNLATGDHWSEYKSLIANNGMIPGMDEVECLHPMMLTSWASREDTSTWHQAMNGPNADDFWGVMNVEVNTLERKMNSWDVVTRQPDMNVLDST